MGYVQDSKTATLWKFGSMGWRKNTNTDISLKFKQLWFWSFDGSSYITPRANTWKCTNVMTVGQMIITLIWYDCTTSSFPLIRTPVAPVAKIERLADRNVSAKACDCCSNLWSQRGQRQEHMTHARPHGASTTLYTRFSVPTPIYKINQNHLSLIILASFVFFCSVITMNVSEPIQPLLSDAWHAQRHASHRLSSCKASTGLTTLLPWGLKHRGALEISTRFNIVEPSTLAVLMIHQNVAWICMDCLSDMPVICLYIVCWRAESQGLARK